MLFVAGRLRLDRMLWTFRLLSITFVGTLVIGVCSPRVAAAEEQGGGPTATATPRAASEPPPRLVVPGMPLPQKKIVYVLALADDATAARLTLELAYRLRRQRVIRDAFILPMPTWKLKEYVQQCKTSKDTTAGAFIITPPSIGSAIENRLLYTESWTRTIFGSFVAVCDPASSGAENTLSVAWVSNTYAGTGTRYSATLLPLAVLATLYQTFAPTRANETDTTIKFPPPVPLPPTGARDIVVTKSTTTANAAGTQSLTTALFGAFAGNSLGFGSPSSVDPQTQYAMAAAMEQLADDVLRACGRPPSFPAPRPTPSTSIAVLDRLHPPEPPSSSIIVGNYIPLRGTKVHGWGKAFSSALNEVPMPSDPAAFCNW